MSNSSKHQKLRSFCQQQDRNGKYDMALLVMITSGFVALSFLGTLSYFRFQILYGKVGSNKPINKVVQLPHVKPACSSHRHLLDDNIQNRTLFTCFTGGWGNTGSNKTHSFGLSRNFKYAEVEIVDPELCKEHISGDKYLSQGYTFQYITPFLSHLRATLEPFLKPS